MKLQENDLAPDFKAQDQNGKEHQLSDFRGRRLALFFYPKDMTPGCTSQVCNLRDNYKALTEFGIELLGVSVDDMDKHKKFVDKHELPFPLLDDSKQVIVENYGVWGMKKFMGKEFMGTHRTTFLINEEGIIEHIIEKVKTKDHAAQILELWNEAI